MDNKAKQFERKVGFYMNWDDYRKERLEDFYTRLFGHKVKCIGIARDGTPLIICGDET